MRCGCALPHCWHPSPGCLDNHLLIDSVDDLTAGQHDRTVRQCFTWNQMGGHPRPRKIGTGPEPEHFEPDQH